MTAPSLQDPGPTEDARVRAWRIPLAWTSGIVVGADVVFLLLIATIVPPLVAAAALTLVGLLLLRRRPRAAAGVIGATMLVTLALGAPFALPHLAHPASAVDFVHASLSTAGRLLAALTAAGLWWGASTVAARRLTATAVGLAAMMTVVAGVATVTAGSEVAQPDDVVVPVAASRFPEIVTVVSGGSLYLDNTDLFRHTFTVPDTDLDAELPAGVAVRVAIDLAPGRYPVICDVPGHELMTATLEVR